jgi:hypothetical protein
VGSSRTTANSRSVSGASTWTRRRGREPSTPSVCPQQRGKHARIREALDQLAGSLDQSPSASQLASTVTHGRQHQQRERPVHAHAVNLEQLQGPIQLHLGLGELPVVCQRPTQRQVDDPTQRLEAQPVRVDDRQSATRQRGGGAIALVAGDQRQHRQRGGHVVGLHGFRHPADQFLQPQPGLSRVPGVGCEAAWSGICNALPDGS